MYYKKLAEVRKLTAEELVVYLQQVSNEYSRIAWLDDFASFKAVEAYVKKLLKAGFTIPPAALVSIQK